ncbi:MAG: cell envelope integrity protein TolA [Clostridia bacterium]|nr:cell envelope integrity protein TolA [Clostridia bacterium]
MKWNKIISTLLAVLMLMSTFVVVIGAEGEEEKKPYTYNTNSTTSLMAPNPNTNSGTNKDPYLYKTGQYLDANGETKVISSPEEKLALMDYRYGNGTYELYIDAYSGEIAVKNTVSGEILFSNPYDIGTSTASVRDNGVKEELLSQLVVNYTEITSGKSGAYHSYTWAAERSQIVVKNIKGGLRVEYTIGREETKSLVPRQISVESMEKKIFNVIEASMTNDADGFTYEDSWNLDRIKGFFLEQNLETAITDEIRETIRKTYPVTEKFPIYILDTGLSEAQIKQVESYIKLYCPDYTFEDLAEDHAKAEYEGTTETYPLFKMALEYTLDENGLVVRLPANGIRFDETLYRLDSVEILPYMGAGSNPNPGYTFFPDGSGTLFDFEDLAALGTRQQITGKMYGQDYAYHEISGTYEEILRYPVFGIAETETFTRDVIDQITGEVTGTETYTKDRGFVAIIEEGDSLMQLSSYHAGQTSEYNTIKMSVFPRPTDTYNIADAISVGTNSEWTVVSERKYTGSYQIRYIMLTDDQVAQDTAMEKHYECSYVGMATAYREYLEAQGVLTRLTAADVTENIPLYIQTFGALWTTEKILSIPFDVMTPLTSFQDITKMYDELEAQGVKNINFIMTGYTKGGLEAERVPYNLKWDKAVREEMDFDELVAYAKEKGFGVFPDFDFVFAGTDTYFDGLSLKKHAVKTIDNRYTSKREYSATKQTYIGFFELAISPAYFSHFYEKFIPKYQEYNPIGISVSTLGAYLNSDFDEDEPYNRADNQQFTVEAFEYISKSFENAEVMTSGGNAYCWKYVDHITDVALDSSRFSVSSAAVPFLGIVLHGYVEIAGAPINMEGNLEYSFLKALENGAGLNFILSYRNTDNLKDYENTSQYYSVRYDIWFDDVVSMYNELNALLKDVQTSTIVAHEFVDGTRVPDNDELESDARNALLAAIEAEEALKKAESEAEREKILAARMAIIYGTQEVKDSVDPANEAALQPKLESLRKAVEESLPAAIEASKQFNNLVITTNQLKSVYDSATNLKNSIAAQIVAYNEAKGGLTYLKEKNAFDAAYTAQLEARLDAALEAAYATLQDMDAQIIQYTTAAYNMVVAANLNGLTVEPYVYVPATNDELTPPTGNGESEVQDTRYQSDDNMIVYEAYENGTEFLLNFNDYTVVVELDRDGDGVKESSYTLAAYGYIVISRGA